MSQHFASAAIIVSSLAVSVLGQGQTPAPAPVAPATPAAAQAAPPAAPAKPFALDLALEAAQAALAACKAGPAVVEVMDTAFNPKVVLAADGARANLTELARRKAYTVIKTGMSSGEFGASVGPQARGGPPINGDPNLITFAGALPIKAGTEIGRRVERLRTQRRRRRRGVREGGPRQDQGPREIESSRAAGVATSALQEERDG